MSDFKGWFEKFASWLCLVHDSYASELKEAMNLPYPVVIVNQDQAIRSRRLFHSLQQSFSGYSRVDNVVKSQIASYGIQEANGFELLRLLREFSLMSRPEALRYGEALWKYTLPCIFCACATFPACNWHGGGYAVMFLTIWLNGTLEMMQNDVETSEFEYRSMEIHLFLDDVV